MPTTDRVTEHIGALCVKAWYSYAAVNSIPATLHIVTRQPNRNVNFIHLEEASFVHPRSPAHFLRDNDREVNGNRGIPSPEVCIEPEESKSRTRRHLPRWKLCITIPKSVDSKGWVTYDFGNSSRRTIALSKLSGGSVTYPADPDAPDFKGLWCSPETSLGYQVSIMQKLPGLSKQGLTSFVSVPGRYKPRAHRLIWGTCILFCLAKNVRSIIS